MFDGSITVHWAEARFAPKSRTIATTAMIVLRCYETEEPILEWENDRFVQDARSHKFYYDTHLMWEEDELALKF